MENKKGHTEFFTDKKGRWMRDGALVKIFDYNEYSSTRNKIIRKHYKYEIVRLVEGQWCSVRLCEKFEVFPISIDGMLKRGVGYILKPNFCRQLIDREVVGGVR